MQPMRRKALASVKRGALPGILAVALLAYGASAAEPPNPCEDYRLFLDSLDKTDPNSVGKAVGQYLRMILAEEQHIRDQAFADFLAFYHLASDAVMSPVIPTDRDELLALAEKSPMLKRIDRVDNNGVHVKEYIVKNPFFPDAPPETVRFEETHFSIDRIINDPIRGGLLHRNGLIIGGNAEDGWCIYNDASYVLEMFGRSISPSLREFICLRQKEVTEPMFPDNWLGLEADELARRVDAWEKYREKYPDSLLKPDADILFKSYLSLFIDYTNCTAKEIQEGEDAPFARAYVKYVQDHEHTYSGKAVKEWLDVLKANHFGLLQEPWAKAYLDKFRQTTGFPEGSPTGGYDFDGVYKIIVEHPKTQPENP